MGDVRHINCSQRGSEGPMGVRAISAVMLAFTWLTTSMAQTGPAETTNRLTLIGCVKRSEPVAGGAGAATSEQPRFVLVNITLPADANRDAGSELIAETVKMYRLDESGDSTIVRHVGERVEVTGALVASAQRPAARVGEPALPPMLKVDSLRTISGGSGCDR